MLTKIYNNIIESPVVLKVVKTIVIIIAVIVVINIIVSIVNKYSDILKTSPWLLKGTKTATQPMTIEQNPNNANAVPIKRTHNKGIDFTYSSWLYINDLVDEDKWLHVFHKGSPLRTPLYCPGVWLNGNKNSLKVTVNTFKEIDETLEVTNLPLRKWFHLAIYVNQNSMDIWINGNMVQSKKLNSMPKQNWGNFYITNNGGFDGFISNIQYFAYKLPYYKLENIIKIGPNTGSCIDSGEKPPYFNKEWWLLQ